ncbi:MAG: NAD(P)/FAD-dependent oxidoreductase [Chloroflexota bacterium]
MAAVMEQNTSTQLDMSIKSFDVLIVGAGISGMYMLYKMRELGFSTRVLEKGGGVGGTWYWNRYPGARCDTDTMEYSYSFDEDLQQEWEWPERYPTQPEILRYLEHVADRFELRTDISFNTRVEAATYDAETVRWQVRTEHGDTLSAKFLIMATGCISTPNTPHVDGMDSFTGNIYHTGHWPHEGVDFSGKRVGIIGTGSSGVQSIPVIAAQAEKLIVFQRTAQYTVPARNRSVDPKFVAEIKADYAGFRARNRLQPSGQLSHIPRNDVSALDVDPEERERIYEERWGWGGFPFYGSFNDIMLNEEANKTAAEFVRAKIRSIVKDPMMAEKLSPSHTISCKRPVLDSGYLETFNRPNVELVDIYEAPIQEITQNGVRIASDDETTDYDVDCIVFATGFDAMTGTLLRIDIQGRDGLTLQEKWSAGPLNYLGLSIPGFPNLFTITGPGSPSVLTNMIVAIEQHVEWVADCLDYMRANNHRSIEATVEAQDEWVAHVNATANKTLYPTCSSWYLGVNIPGKPRVFMPLPGFPPYVEKCEDVVANGYEGFVLTPVYD